MTSRDTRRVLRRHFLRRFMDNDLLSAHGDRHESFSVMAATLVSAGLFGTVLLSIKYIFGMPLGQLALTGMEDRLVLITVSMTVTALAAAIQWDALGLDARDAAILGPLPVSRRAMVRAKAAAVGLFALGASGAAAIPHLLFPMASTLQMSVAVTARVLLAQLVAGLAASVFGFFAVLTLREWVRLLLPARVVGRIARVVQTLTIVVVTTGFLVVVGNLSGTAGRWMNSHHTGTGIPASVIPPMWFLGVAESTIGEAIVGPWPAVDVLGRPAANSRSEAAYRSYQPHLQELSAIAWMATLLSVLAGSAAYGINARRVALPTPRPATHSRRGDLLARAALGRHARSPVSRAAFAFTLSVLVRSAPHRLALALGGAIAAAIVVAIVSSAGIHAASSAHAAPLSAWALQTLVLTACLAGLVHAIALPADLEASWILHQSWCGDLRNYMTGMRRAALVLVALPPTAALLPLHVHILGATAALIHAITGLLLAAVVLAALTCTGDRPPFISSYVSRGNLKSAAPLYLMGISAFAFSLAAIERAAARTWLAHLMLPLLLTGILLCIVRGRAGPSTRRPLALDPTADSDMRTLGLSG